MEHLIAARFSRKTTLPSTCASFARAKLLKTLRAATRGEPGTNVPFAPKN